MSERAFPSQLGIRISLALAAAVAALPAAAQRSNSGVAIGPSEELSHPPSERSSAAAPVEHLFHDQDNREHGGRARPKRSDERGQERRPSPPQL